MKKIAIQVLDCFLFSNIFIALCAVAQGLVTYQLLNVKPDKYVLALLFCSTMALYNLSILLSKPKHPEKSSFKRIRWFFSYNRLMISLTIIAVLCLLPIAMFFTTTSLLLLGFLGAISVGYNLPLFTVNDKKIGLRNIPGIKLFLIAMVWSFACVMLPILELESHQTIMVSSRDTILLVAKRFLFVAAITIPFDIRDLFQDKTYELKTIPVVFGERKAYIFCQFLLAVYLIFLFLFTQQFDPNFIGLTLTIVVTGWLIFKSDVKKDEYYYFFLLDGTLILQYLILLLCNHFTK